VTSCLLLIALRPFSETAPAEYWQISGHPACLRLPLEPLPPSDATALVCDRLGVGEMPEAVAAFIREKSGGNPFFSEQVALALLDRGHLVIADGRCRLTAGLQDLADADVPDTIERVVTGRIDTLSPQQQLTVKVASVIGRIFAYRTLFDVHPVETDRADLPTQLDDMVRRELVLQESPAPDLDYLFKHVVLQEVAYNLLPFAQRIPLHRAVAEWLERQFSDELEPHLPLLAHHWVRAEDQGRAVDYLEGAGKQALDNFANTEAIRFLEEALATDGGLLSSIDDRRRSRWEWWLGIAYLKLSDYDHCALHQSQGLRLLGFRVPRTRLGLALSLAGQILSQAVHRLRGSAIVAAKADERARFMQAADMYKYRSEYGFFNTDVLFALQASLQNLNLAERGGDMTQVAEAYSAVGVIAGITGLHPIARYYSDRALAVAEEIQHIPTQAFVHQLIAVYHHSLGTWELVDRHVHRAIEMFDMVGDRFRWEGCLAIKLMLHLHRCEIDALGEVVARLRASAYPDSTAQILAWCHGGRVIEGVLRDQVDETAIADLEDVLESPLAHAERIWAHGVRALAWHRLGQGDKARQAADQALAIALEYPPGTYYVLHALAAAAQVLTDEWALACGRGDVDADALRQRARSAIKALHALSRLVPVAGPARWLHAGRLADAEVKSDRALKAWQRALAEAEKFRMPRETGLACLELGLATDVPSAERMAYLGRAAAVFGELGLTRLQRRAGEAIQGEEGRLER
jgi:tetratricopeptide (TPR) repeat protein